MICCTTFWHGFAKSARMRDEVKLQPQQTRVLEKLKHTDSMLLYHGLGSGKTLTSIASTEGQPADVVVPASLRPNYAKEVEKFTSRPSQRNVMSYEAATKGGLRGGPALVVDEVQRIGTSSTMRSQALRDAARTYKKRILLSGTPMRNTPAELAPIVRLLNPESKLPLDPTEFEHRFIEERKVSPGFWRRLGGMKPGVEQRAINLPLLHQEFKGKVDYHAPSAEHFPVRTDEVKQIEMDPEQASIYKTVTKQANPLIAAKVRANMPLSKRELTQLNAFMTAARMVSNTTRPYGGQNTSNKIKSIVGDIYEGYKADPNFKSVTYSNYLEGGVNEIAKHLEEKGIPYAVFSGGLTDKARKQIVSDYNSGKIKSLLISGAGAEGIDLKGTRLFQVTENHWNQARTEQAIGRAIRYKSHSHLPEEERKVHVVHYNSTLPKSFGQRLFGKPASTAADQYLGDMGDKKQKLINQFLEVLKEEGSQ